METPAKEHTQSKIPFPNRIREYQYPSNMKVMNVTQNGSVRWRSYYWIYMTRALIGNRVAAEEIGNGIWKVFYRNVLLGYFNEKNIREKEKSTRLSTNWV